MATVETPGFASASGMMTDEAVVVQLEALKKDIQARKRAALEAWNNKKETEKALPQRAPVGKFTAGLMKEGQWS